MNRRKFISQSLTGTAVLHPSWNIISKRQSDEKLRFGVIGCNGMGWSNTKSMLLMDDLELIAICDVDQRVTDKRLAEYTKMRDNIPTVYADYRELLENKDIDLVIIGTPDHWHCKIFCDTLEAGKHIYVEKPLANSIEEAFIMRRAAAAHPDLKVQVGQWQRSGPHYREAIDIVRSGDLGNIRLVKTWAYQGWMKPMQSRDNADPPEAVDYKMWLGPAPEKPFNPNRFHFNFRWFWDYAGGLMTDWGVHEIDIALYAMQAEAPKSVMASGGKLAYPNDPAETPDTLQAIFEYEDFNMLWEHATGIDLGPYNRREGIAFIGNNGTLVVDRQGYDVLEENLSVDYSQEGASLMKLIDPVKRPKGVRYLDLHTKNLIAAIRKNNSAILYTPIDSGSIAAINAHMGNVAFKTGEKIYWDGKQSRFSSAEASAMIEPTYHNGWKLPQY
ncbi:MAG: Gfo/Idh/MocA family oxidoreductase [Saprospiraceae bacterium]|nr:Gfo/Idh/MocA family oxidoreductase [Saprospiraceae bacterium]